MLEIAKVSQFGWKKHEIKFPEGNWNYLDVPGAETVYLEAESRHLVAEVIEGSINAQDGDVLHKAQKAWNALADLEVYLRSREQDE
jgi:hypothetical protein